MKLRRFYGPYFILGCIFLFDPVIKLFDLLPNAVGCLLIAISLKEISALEYRIENAARLLYYCAGVGVLRVLLMFSTFSMNSSDMLSAVTVLGLLELFLLIYFFISFYGGLSYLAQRSDSENVLGQIDSVRTLGIVFIIVHTAASILPELTALIEVALDHDPDAFVGLSLGRLKLYKNYAVVICALVSLIAGIWWLKETAVFFGGVKKDSLFRTSVEKRYGEYVGDTPHEEFFIRLKSVLVLMLIACVFCMNLRIYDEVALHHTLIIPAWVGTLIFGFCAWRLGVGGFALFPYAAFGAVQFVLGHLLTEGIWASVGEAIIPAITLCVVIATEQILKKRLYSYMDLDVKTELIRQHIALALYVALSVAHAIKDISLLHGFKVVCFVLWLAFTVWTYSAINDEIKLRRKTH